MSDELPRFLTPKQAARELQLSEHYVRKHAADLGAIRIGTKLRYPRGVILSLQETGRLPDSWHADPEQARTTASANGTGPSAGANRAGSKSKKAGTRPKGTPTTARAKSPGAFAKDFPEFAHLVQLPR